MERGIKYAHLRYMRHKLRAYADTDQVRRIVKRRTVILKGVKKVQWTLVTLFN